SPFGTAFAQSGAGRVPMRGSLRFGRGSKGLGHGPVRTRSHLPLRGKLGWMTPLTRSRLGRVTERGFGAADPKRQPFFFQLAAAAAAEAAKILQFSANSLSLARQLECSP